jgi:hypothetical protein
VPPLQATRTPSNGCCSLAPMLLLPTRAAAQRWTTCQIPRPRCTGTQRLTLSARSCSPMHRPNWRKCCRCSAPPLRRPIAAPKNFDSPINDHMCIYADRHARHTTHHHVPQSHLTQAAWKAARSLVSPASNPPRRAQPERQDVTVAPALITGECTLRAAPRAAAASTCASNCRRVFCTWRTISCCSLAVAGADARCRQPVPPPPRSCTAPRTWRAGQLPPCTCMRRRVC